MCSARAKPLAACNENRQIAWCRNGVGVRDTPPVRQCRVSPTPGAFPCHRRYLSPFSNYADYHATGLGSLSGFFTLERPKRFLPINGTMSAQDFLHEPDQSALYPNDDSVTVPGVTVVVGCTAAHPTDVVDSFT